jgi:predicted kinase
MMGYPGSGKTIASKIIAKNTNAVHLWADHIRREKIGEPTYSISENRSLYSELNEKTAELLKQGISVVFDTNFNFYKDRQRLRKIAAQYSATCQLIWVQTPKKLAKTRAVDEAHLHQSRILGAMPEAQFSRLAKNLEPPQESESFIALDGTKLTPAYIKKMFNLHENN